MGARPSVLEELVLFAAPSVDPARVCDVCRDSPRYSPCLRKNRSEQVKEEPVKLLKNGLARKEWDSSVDPPFCYPFPSD